MKIRRHPLLLDATWMDKYKYDDSEKMWEEEKACGRLAVFVGLTRTNTHPDRPAKVAASDQKKEPSPFRSSPNNDAAARSDDKRKRKQNNKNRPRGKMSDGTRRLPPVVVARFETVWLDSWRYHDAECLSELCKEGTAGRQGGHDLRGPRANPALHAEAACILQAVVGEPDNCSPPKRPESPLGASSVDANMVDAHPNLARRSVMPTIVEVLNVWVDKFIYEKAEEAYYIDMYVEREREHQVNGDSANNETPRHGSARQQTPKAAAVELHDAAEHAALESVWLQDALYRDAEARHHEREATEHLKAWQRAQASVGAAKVKKSKRQRQMKTSKRATNEPKEFAQKSNSVSPNRKILGGAEKKLIGSIPLQAQTSRRGVALSRCGLPADTTPARSPRRRQQRPPPYVVAGET